MGSGMGKARKVKDVRLVQILGRNMLCEALSDPEERRRTGKTHGNTIKTALVREIH